MNLRLRKPNAILVSAIESSNVTLECKIDSNTGVYGIEWVFYNLLSDESQPVNMKRLASVTNEVNQVSSIQLRNIKQKSTGYYECSIAINIFDDIGNLTSLKQSFSYYLNIQSKQLNQWRFLTQNQVSQKKFPKKGSIFFL